MDKLVSVLVLVWAASAALPPVAAAQSGPPSSTTAPSEAKLPVHLKDRGTGVATSMFATYVHRGELIVYPFFEYYRDHNFEYAPKEFGFAGEGDYNGRYRASEGLLFLAYGVTDDVAFEMEGAVIKASLEKSPFDPSAMPTKTKESGLGDVEMQLRGRWLREKERRPEAFSYFEVVLPHHRKKNLIGTADWQLKAGGGLTKGFGWGTLTGRLAVEYDAASASPVDWGELAFEYVKRLSPAWRLYAGFEGTPGAVSLITEVQWHVSPRVCLKLNNGLAVNANATDWTPEIGVLFTLPLRR